MFDKDTIIDTIKKYVVGYPSDDSVHVQSSYVN